MNKPLHVLIVDDDPDDTDFLADSFLSHLPGTQFTICRNGQGAVEFLTNASEAGECPDVAFIDLHMPGKSGFQVLLELRAFAACKDLPVMVISTSMMDAETERCRAAGCDGYFTKPSSLDGYEEIVETTIGFLKAGNKVTEQ